MTSDINNVNTSDINLTLWINNTALFCNIRTYLCDENKGELYYIIDTQGTIYYNHSSSYKSRSYVSFLNHIKNISKFQKKLKSYYKNKYESSMFQKQIYLVSVIIDDALPEIKMFFNKDEATNSAFNEAKLLVYSKIPFSDKGNYMLINKKKKNYNLYS
jgi:hypothetical protein